MDDFFGSLAFINLKSSNQDLSNELYRSKSSVPSISKDVFGLGDRPDSGFEYEKICKCMHSTVWQ